MNTKTMSKLSLESADIRPSLVSGDYQNLARDINLGESACKNSPRKSVYSAPLSKPTNAQIIAELTRARCAFQLRTICAVMGVKS